MTHYPSMSQHSVRPCQNVTWDLPFQYVVVSVQEEKRLIKIYEARIALEIILRFCIIQLNSFILDSSDSRDRDRNCYRVENRTRTK